MDNVTCQYCGAVNATPEGSFATTCQLCGSRLPAPDFDVFISCLSTSPSGSSTEDHYTALSLHRDLTAAGISTFYAPVTLKNCPSGQQDRWVDAVLPQARVMLVVGHRPENFQRISVKRQWIRFLQAIREDPTRIMIPICKHPAAGSLPQELKHLQVFYASVPGYGKELAAKLKPILARLRTPAPPIKKPAAIAASGPAYDVFLCCLNTDPQGLRTSESQVARFLHQQLTQQNFRVFYAPLSLTDCPGGEYAARVDHALESARVMVTLGVRAEHLTNPVVYDQWSRFLAMAQSDPGRLLIPCYRDMAPGLLPHPLLPLSPINLGQATYLRELTQRIRGHLARRSPSPAPKADISRLEDALLARQKAAITSLVTVLSRIRDQKQCNQAQSEADEYRLNFLYSAAKLMAQARTEIGYLKAAEQFRRIAGYKDAAQLARLCQQEAEQLRRESIYTAAHTQAAIGTAEGLQKAAELLQTIPGYKDADEKLSLCRRGIELSRLQEVYAAAKAEAQKVTPEALEKAAKMLRTISGYNDADQAADECLQEAGRLRNEAVYAAAKAEAQKATPEALEKAAKMLRTISGYNNADQAADECLQEARRLRNEAVYTAAKAEAQKATPEALEKAAKMLRTISGYQDAAQMATQCLAEAETIRHEAVYQSAAALAAKSKPEELEKAAKLFLSIPGHKDAPQQAEECSRKRQELLQRRQARKEQTRQKIRQIEDAQAHWLREQKAARHTVREQARKAGDLNRVMQIVITLVVAVLLMIALLSELTAPDPSRRSSPVLLLLPILIPLISFSASNRSQARQAEALREAGQYDEALLAFLRLPIRRDVRSRKAQDCEKYLLAQRQAEYDQARKQLSSRSYEAALTAFLRLEDYKDSPAKADLCRQQWLDSIQ